MSEREFIFLKRHPVLAEASFRQAWSAHLMQRLADPARRDEADLVQNYVRPGIAGITPEPIWDAVLQIEPAANATVRDALTGRDADGLVDRGQVLRFMAVEHVMVEGPGHGVKILALTRRREGMTTAEFQQYYGGIHGPLVAAAEDFAPFLSRYVQHHVIAETVEKSPDFKGYDGISEFWFASMEAARAAWSTTSYQTSIRADALRFVGSQPSHRLIVDEERLPAGAPWHPSAR